MSSYNFKGDLEQVSGRQLEYIEEVLKKKGIKGPEVTLEPVGAIGDNYIANVKRVIVENDGKMVAKLASNNPKMRINTNIKLLFRNEHIVYTEIMPKFNQLQIEAGLRGDDIFRYPECYASLSEEPNEVILLEDLKESNLVNLNRFKYFSNECVKVILKYLAKFHALSCLVLKAREPEMYSSVKSRLKNLKDLTVGIEDWVEPYFANLESMALNILHEEKHKKNNQRNYW